MNVQTNNIIINNIISSLEESFNIIEDITVRTSFSDFMKVFFAEDFDLKNKSRIQIHCTSVEVISNYIKHKSLDEFNWQFLCSTMHHSNLMKFININNINNYMIDKICNTSKQILKSYYLYLINNFDYNSTSLNQLRSCNHLIKKRYEQVNKPYLPPNSRKLLERYILTSYPLDSQPKSIYQVYDKSNTKSYSINLNSTNDFLIELIKGFIDKLACGPRVNASHRIFYYYFEESFGDLKIPDAIKDFTIDTFSQQVKFYNDIINKLNFNGLLRFGSKTSNAVVPPQRILVQFYIYLIDYIENSNLNYNIFEDSWITKSLLKSTGFLKHYCNDYIYIYYNKLEDVPPHDKWWLSPGEDAKKSTKLTINNTAIDFTKISDPNLKQKLKEWIWYGYGNSNIIRRMNGSKAIFDFLEFKDNYKDQLKKINYIHKEKIDFSMELFYRFRLFYETKFDNKKTLTERFIDLRSFLNFISNEYYINKKCFKYLEVKNSSDEDMYGCPITQKDFKLILNEFKVMQHQLDYGVLLTNIFYLASTTNLRPSEILSLERNCIVYKDTDGNGTIKLKRKVSKGVYVHQELDAESIKLIESSISISNEWVQYLEKDSDKNFIFIGKILSNSFGNNYRRLSGAFAGKFRSIVLKLESELDNYYTPYNLRDTFINIVYDNYKKYDENDIDKLQRITGNSYSVVMKHYRRKFAIKEYVEVMSKVIISDVDINGDILKDDSSINDKSPVNGDLGVCELSECNPSSDINYALENQCLFCNNFITSLSRIKSFEKKIQTLRERIDSLNINNSISEMEKKLLLTDLKLCCAYLTKMLEIKSNSY